MIFFSLFREDAKSSLFSFFVGGGASRQVFLLCFRGEGETPSAFFPFLLVGAQFGDIFDHFKGGAKSNFPFFLGGGAIWQVFLFQRGAQHLLVFPSMKVGAPFGLIFFSFQKGLKI